MEKLIALLEITEHSLLKFLNKYTFLVHSPGGVGAGVKFPKELESNGCRRGGGGRGIRWREFKKKRVNTVI